MNTSNNGRWNRFIKINGVKHKKCNGPLHEDQVAGALLPLNSFWMHKSGKREGKLFSRCIDCCRFEKGRTNSGYIRLDLVSNIFLEIESRIGRAEAMRRLNVGHNYFWRLDHNLIQSVEKATVAKAILVLQDLRTNDEVRHRDSIRHGAAARGRKEKVVTERDHLYKPHGDDNTEQKRAKRRATAGE